MGDAHYDVLSALQKSIRGSDVNASLHYAARLIEAGDLPSLARRLTIIAYEDIGLANPDAQIHTVTALEAAQRIGFPEARILIANVVIDLALSPKSNSAYVAMDKAIADLHKSGTILFLATYVMVITLAVKNWAMPKIISTRMPIRKNGLSSNIYQTNSKELTILLPMKQVNTNGHWGLTKTRLINFHNDALYKKWIFNLNFFNIMVSYLKKNCCGIRIHI